MSRWKNWLIGAAFMLILMALLSIAHAQVGTGQFADEEQPAGAIDGTNAVFKLHTQPLPWLSLKLYLNGIRQFRCRDGNTACDYTLIPPHYNQVQFTIAPQPGDLILADYRY